MINKSKELAIEAKNTLDAYNQKINKKHIKPITCICCKQTEIKPESGAQSPNPLKQEDGKWVNGGVAVIHFGYGSDHDDENYYVGICDKCVTEFNDLLISQKKLREKFYKDIV
jgi:hypothetical protein